MKKLIVLAFGLAGGLIMAGGALAEGGFQAHYTDCVDKFASSATSASVMLECNAEGGKLGACKVVDNSAPGRGFDKAAMCVAAFLPMGAKTGVVRVPLSLPSAWRTVRTGRASRSAPGWPQDGAAR